MIFEQPCRWDTRLSLSHLVIRHSLASSIVTSISSACINAQVSCRYSFDFTMRPFGNFQVQDFNSSIAAENSSKWKGVPNRFPISSGKEGETGYGFPALLRIKKRPSYLFPLMRQ